MIMSLKGLLCRQRILVQLVGAGRGSGKRQTLGWVSDGCCQKGTPIVYARSRRDCFLSWLIEGSLINEEGNLKLAMLDSGKTRREGLLP